MKNEEYPWYKFYDDIPTSIDYLDTTLISCVEEVAKKYPYIDAYDFLGRKVTYKEFVSEIIKCSKSFKALGIKKNDRVTICMPNIPQAIVSIYALNMIGAVASLIHPLSSVGEIEFYLKTSKSVAFLTLDDFYPKLLGIIKNYKKVKMIFASIKDVLGPVKKIGYTLIDLGSILPFNKIPYDNQNIISWSSFIKNSENYKKKYREKRRGKDLAIIMYSGGTTGTTKGVMLTNNNINALAMQITVSNKAEVKDKMLAILPIFHAFGFGVCVHSAVSTGMCSILVPRFDLKETAKTIKRTKPNYLVGVPAMFSAIINRKEFKNLDLSSLKNVYSGGDFLNEELRSEFNKYLKQHNSSVKIRQGYGTTECVGASCLMPKDSKKKESIGIPLPDMLYKIVDLNTIEEVSYGLEGEICVSGPTIMLGYLDNIKETKQVLKTHSDGKLWLHTGDRGYMDKDGFIYFVRRIKRVIVSRGYTIYPTQLELVINKHPSVQMSSVIGIPNKKYGEIVKAFIVLKTGVKNDSELIQSLNEHFKATIAKFSIPKLIEIREELPITRVGKIAYKELEREEIEKLKK